SKGDTNSVLQTPPFIIKRTGESVTREINFSHKTTSFQRIYWYKQDEHKALKLLGYLNVDTPYPENDVKEKISFDGDGRKASNLTVSNLSLNDSCVYFCAASQHSAADSPQVNTKTLLHLSADGRLVKALQHLQPPYKPALKILSTFVDTTRIKRKYKEIDDKSSFAIYTGLIDGSDVIQTDILWTNQGENATMNCNHTKGFQYRQMYWYRQLPEKAMEQIVFTTLGINDHDFGSFGKEKYSATKPNVESGTFTVKNLQPGDKGLYFCAVSKHSDSDM
ncbi:hypothetical protein L3Q82_026299, partial [Scortum barcoo]